MRQLLSFFAFFSLIVHLSAGKKNYSFVMTKTRNTGMFCVLDDVLHLVHLYDKSYLQSIEVNFDTAGPYYEPAQGKNWFNYYFEPIQIGKKIHAERGRRSNRAPFIEFAWERLDHRQEAHRLIQKYLHVKSDIQATIDAFVQNHFKGHFVISVHYRGTDKMGTEAPFISYKKVIRKIKQVMTTYGKLSYRIFLASDEQGFIDAMSTCFGSLVCFNPSVIRSTSGNSIHHDVTQNRYECGKEALTDCILLSKGDILIKTHSNLSRWSALLNPNIHVIPLSYDIHKKQPSGYFSKLTIKSSI